MSGPACGPPWCSTPQQIDGLPPAPDRPVPPEWERHARAETILANAGVPIRHVPGDRAFYRLAEDTITLPERGQFASGDRYYATALHELGTRQRASRPAWHATWRTRSAPKATPAKSSALKSLR